MAYLQIDQNVYFLPDPCIVDIRVAGKLVSRFWIENDCADFMGALDVSASGARTVIPTETLKERLEEAT